MANATDDLFERALDAARSSARVDEFCITERQRRRLSRRADEPRAEDVQLVTLDLFRDSPTGRAGFSVDVTPRDVAALDALIEGAARDAAEAVGPSWRLPPASAPAQVPLDDELVRERPTEAIARVRAALREAGAEAEIVTADVETTRVATSHGLRVSFVATSVDVAARVRDRGQVSRVRVRRRRLDELDLEGRADRARARCAMRAAASVAESGTYDLVVRHDALDAWASGWGLLGPLAAQAAVDAAGRGIARYLPGQAALAGDGDPITLWSDGALPYGHLSRPCGQLGEAVRRFALVEDNRAVDTGRDARHAGLTGKRANGGVRNLVLTPGARADEELLAPTTGPVLDVSAWSWLRTDAGTGSLLGQVEAGVARRPGVPPQPVAGNLVAGDLFACWSNALLGSEATFLGWYSGPAVVKLRGVRVSG